MKVAIVTIGRLENLYIRDFCNYYKNLGVDNIILGDNNYSEEEYFEDAINDYIRTGFVIKKDLRDKKEIQLDFYNNMLYEYYNEFNWIIFIDIDEFLFIDNYYNIKDWLSSYKYQKFLAIKVNEMHYGDSDKLYYENKPVYERFYKPALFNIQDKISNVLINAHIKSIIHTGLFKQIDNAEQIINHLVFKDPHNLLYLIPVCNSAGEETNNSLPFVMPISFDEAHFKHYVTKTISEFLDIKYKRGFPDGNTIMQDIGIEKYFFRVNKWTQEKQDIIDNYKKKYGKE